MQISHCEGNNNKEIANDGNDLIYDQLLRELETMCQEQEVELSEIDLSTVAVCKHCGLPFSPKDRRQKYHPECYWAAQQKINRDNYLKAKESKPVCQCCGLLPIGDGMRFLCHRCYEWDGNEWTTYYRTPVRGKRGDAMEARA